jgi:hypothetical protein
MVCHSPSSTVEKLALLRQRYWALPRQAVSGLTAPSARRSHGHGFHQVLLPVRLSKTFDYGRPARAFFLSLFIHSRPNSDSASL